MAGRRCASCGISLPRTTSRCPSCGHVESDAIVVEIDGPPESGPAGGGRRRGRDLLVIASVLIALAVGLVVVSDDRGEDDDAAAAARSTTTTTERQRPRRTTRTTRPTTTTTTTLRVLTGAPLLGEPTGLVLVSVDTNGRPIAIDLDTGNELRLPSSIEFAPGAFRNGPRGGFVGMHNGQPAFIPLDGGTPMRLGGYDPLPVPGGDSFFVVEFSPGAEQQVREVGVDGAERARFTVRGSVAGAMHRGVVVISGGRLYLVERDGDVTPLTSGDVFAVGEESLLALTCDDALRCAPHLIAPGRVPRPLPDPPDGTFWFLCCNAVISPGDRLLAGAPVSTDGVPPQRVLIVDLIDMQILRTIERDGAAAFSWSPDGRWLVIAGRSTCLVVEVRTGEEREIEVPCDASAMLIAR